MKHSRSGAQSYTLSQDSQQATKHTKGLRRKQSPVGKGSQDHVMETEGGWKNKHKGTASALNLSRTGLASAF